MNWNLLYSAAVSLLLFNCTHEMRPEKVVYNPVAVAKCVADPQNVYHYTTPVTYAEKLPLIILLDSHGNGLLAINKTEPAVDRIPCILVGSDIVRNDLQGYAEIIDGLIREAKQKFRVDPEQIYLAGFSGGARMALDYARTHAVKGLLMCSAGGSPEILQHLTCRVYMIAGTDDFNFAETYYNPLDKSRSQRYVSDYFRGTHAWPPASAIQAGLLFLMRQTGRNAGELSKQVSLQLTEKADSLLRIEDGFMALKSLEKAVNLDPRNMKAKREMERFRHEGKALGAIRQLESDLVLESRIDQAYAQASLLKDSLWWYQELAELNHEIENNTGEKKDHFLRIKAFLGIFFFSRLNTLLHNQPGDNQIVQLLAAYKEAEPENPDVYYDYALYALQRGKKKECRKALELALSKGFTDRDKMARDFPADLRSGLPSND